MGQEILASQRAAPGWVRTITKQIAHGAVFLWAGMGVSGMCYTFYLRSDISNISRVGPVCAKTHLPP